MAFLRDLMTVLMVSIWVRTATGATTSSSSAKVNDMGGLSETCKQAGYTVEDEVGLCAHLYAPSKILQEGPEVLQVVPPSNFNPKISYAMQSVSAKIKHWLTSMCQASACSSASLASATKSLKAGCGTEMFSGWMVAGSSNSLLTNYNTIRADICPIIANIKLNVCGATLQDRFQVVVDLKLPFLLVKREAYCAQCGPNHSLCKPGSPSTMEALSKKPIVYILPVSTRSANPQGQVQPKKQPKSI
ncbi:hypothetical protein PTTG_05448 [Puccinia triticina 1-1 BBBD Race 1]|uniref:Uncharacterized protein n=2 Tax=Puccinia triticina TaxID=208348 RepID=A0A0C4EXA0_PUCT1|nr:uncharacterized protein PtA15_6A564 [Puccinia triticina]OAV95395.1 hypothetical protein PTTG_05448 [Puccinia triticina 1-1 BBBD Race 1]WAQ85935.1 hypothetical protein PtA15_6A564 [Puccinia triticina]WAR55830.1 hypothetical protein PtB15_6B573 [Puccinia triticina]